MKPLRSFSATATPAIFIFVLLFWSCEQVSEGVFFEANGIVSIRAQSLGEQENWVARPYYTSVPMISVEGTTASGSLTFPFYIQTTGEYFLWILTAQNQNNPEIDRIHGLILDENDYLVDSFQLRLNDSNALHWMNREQESGDQISTSFEQPGIYKVVLQSQGQPGFVIDKIHLSLQNSVQPEGFGLPETSDSDMYPRVAKREQPVAIPPAWAFGVLYGGQTTAKETIRKTDRLNEDDFPIDACWIDSSYRDSEQNSIPIDPIALEEAWSILHERGIKAGIRTTDSLIQSDTSPLFERGLDFLVLPQDSDISFTKKAFEATQKHEDVENSRGFVLGSLQNAYDPDFKKYPTIYVSNTAPVWSQPVNSDFSKKEMGGLMENIQMVADPRLSTYEIPFLAHATGGYNSDKELDINDELYIRWIQFAAFNSMMAVSNHTESENSPYYFSGLAQAQFKRLTHLRNRLFPYIYSLAHLVRATGEKPVRGDGAHPTQFQLGDAFLVAPVYEEGSTERVVSLPEGLWYDYWDGTTYQGGQDWIVEAPLSKIPVFVKAGSIVPYREYSQTILEGTNNSLAIEVYGGGNGTFRLYEDDGLTTSYRRGELATTAFRYFEGDGYSTFTIGSMVDGYEGQTSEKELQILFKFTDEPTQITSNGEHLERGEGSNRWIYNREEQTIILNWTQSNYQKTDFEIRF